MVSRFPFFLYRISLMSIILFKSNKEKQQMKYILYHLSKITSKTGDVLYRLSDQVKHEVNLAEGLNISLSPFTPGAEKQSTIMSGIKDFTADEARKLMDKYPGGKVYINVADNFSNPAPLSEKQYERYMEQGEDVQEQEQEQASANPS